MNTFCAPFRPENDNEASDMNLSGDQFKQLQQALMSAFPSVAKLAMMVRTGVGENLRSVAGGDDLAEVTFNLITWAEADGRLEELVQKAYDANPGNLELQSFAEQYFPLPIELKSETRKTASLRTVQDNIEGQLLPQSEQSLATENRSDTGNILPRGNASANHSSQPERSVALLYKRNISSCEYLVKLLETELPSYNCTVFVDRHVSLGEEWSQEIRRQVRAADAVIPLLSAESIWSEMVEAEVKTAHEAAQQQGGKPRLLPVRVKFTGALPEPLGAILNSLQYKLWEGPKDDDKLVQEIALALQKPTTRYRYDRVTGAVPLDSPFYIPRTADDEFCAAIQGQEGIIRIRGARQIGKTSLLARGLQQARDAGMRVVITDLQALDDGCLVSAEQFYKALMKAVIEQLHLKISLHDMWDPDAGENDNMRSFILEQILRASPKPFVWGLDEVDRLFACSFGNQIFGMFRAWYNLRALNPHEAWGQLTLAIAYATEAQLFITNLDQSPFNVGMGLKLGDFTLEQVEALNRRYDQPLQKAEHIAAFYRLVGGQPYLTRRGLHEIVTRGLNYPAFDAEADQDEDEGPFSDHLHRILTSIRQDVHTVEAVRSVLQGEPCPSEYFYRLRSAGII